MAERSKEREAERQLLKMAEEAKSAQDAADRVQATAEEAAYEYEKSLAQLIQQRANRQKPAWEVPCASV